MVENVATDVRIHSGKGVIQENDIGTKIYGSCDIQPLPLTCRDCDSALSDLRKVAASQHLNVRPKGASIDNVMVPYGIISSSKKNVISDSRVLDPSILGAEASRSPHYHFSIYHAHVACKSSQK